MVAGGPFLEAEDRDRAEEMKAAFQVDLSEEMSFRRQYTNSQIFQGGMILAVVVVISIWLATLPRLNELLPEVLADATTSLIAIEGVVVALLWGTVSADLRSTRQQYGDIMWRLPDDIERKKKEWDRTVRNLFKEIDRYKVKIKFIGWMGSLALILTISSFTIPLIISTSETTQLTIFLGIFGLGVLIGLIFKFLIRPLG